MAQGRTPGVDSLQVAVLPALVAVDFPAMSRSTCPRAPERRNTPCGRPYSRRSFGLFYAETFKKSKSGESGGERSSWMLVKRTPGERQKVPAHGEEFTSYEHDLHLGLAHMTRSPLQELSAVLVQIATTTAGRTRFQTDAWQSCYVSRKERKKLVSQKNRKY